MEEITPQLTQIIDKISPIPLSLKISNTGEVNVTGDWLTEDLQPILDNSYLKYQLYLKHQKELVRESNLTSLCIGGIFSALIGIAVFCCFNQAPKNLQQSLQVQNYGTHG
jgi:hypothetical protein